jgi:hypothetical protein
MIFDIDAALTYLEKCVVFQKISNLTLEDKPLRLKMINRQWFLFVHF